MPCWRQLRAALDVVLEGRVAAVDEDVALVQQRRELVDRRLRGVAVGQHDPDDARRLERGDDVGELADRLGAFGAELLRLGVGAVPDHHPVPAAQQAPRHVAAHAAQPDHRYVHHILLVPPGHARGVISTVEARRRRDPPGAEPALNVVTEADAQGAAAVSPQGAEVAARLGALEHAEAVGLARDAHVVGVVPHQLQEQTPVGTALVKLACGVQKARAVAQRRGETQADRAAPGAASGGGPRPPRPGPRTPAARRSRPAAAWARNAASAAGSSPSSTGNALPAVAGRQILEQLADWR